VRCYLITNGSPAAAPVALLPVELSLIELPPIPISYRGTLVSVRHVTHLNRLIHAVSTHAALADAFRCNFWIIILNLIYNLFYHFYLYNL